MKKILTIVGTRPNFIKITQFERVFRQYPNLDHRLLHTGQHFDENMSRVFFEELQIKKPDYFLNLNYNSVITQMAEIMKGIEDILLNHYAADLIIVVGDVNSTFAGALAANKCGIPLAHVESGLRSFDRRMPEENNRLLTDTLTDFFFVTEKSGRENLLKEGHPEEKIHFVGNTMIDTLSAFDPVVQQSGILPRLNTQPGNYALMTMHRPSNVDTKEGLKNLITIIQNITNQFPLIFPIHPRTRKKLEDLDLYEEINSIQNLKLIDPIGYLDFQNLIANALCVVTDSGGIQEETTARRIPCITLRPNTERPSTVEEGSNTLIPDLDPDKVSKTIHQIINNQYKACRIPPLWDGKASERIGKVINEKLG